MTGPSSKVKGGGDRRNEVNKPAPADATPIKTPNPTDAQSRQSPAETPKVGSQDAPGG